MAAPLNIIALYQKLFEDKRLTVWHLSLMSGVIFLFSLNPDLGYVEISRKQLMVLAHINGVATYHKCIRQLQNYGYIVYKPTFNYYARSKIEIVDFHNKSCYQK